MNSNYPYDDNFEAYVSGWIAGRGVLTSQGLILVDGVQNTSVLRKIGEYANVDRDHFLKTESGKLNLIIADPRVIQNFRQNLDAHLDKEDTMARLPRKYLGNRLTRFFVRGLLESRVNDVWDDRDKHHLEFSTQHEELANQIRTYVRSGRTSEGVIRWSDHHIIDLLGFVYNSCSDPFECSLYNAFIKICNLSLDRTHVPMVLFERQQPSAFAPIKQFFSDVTYDLSIVNLQSNQHEMVYKYDTYILPKIPSGYYLEITSHPDLTDAGYILMNSGEIVQSGCEKPICLTVFATSVKIAPLKLPFKAGRMVLKKIAYVRYRTLNPRRTEKTKRSIPFKNQQGSIRKKAKITQDQTGDSNYTESKPSIKEEDYIDDQDVDISIVEDYADDVEIE